MHHLLVALVTGSVRQAMARVRKTPKYRHLVKRLQAEQAAGGKNGAAPARKRPSGKPKKVRLGGDVDRGLLTRVFRACLRRPCGLHVAPLRKRPAGKPWATFCRQVQGRGTADSLHQTSHTHI